MAGNSLDLNKLVFDLYIREAIYEHLFGDELSDRYNSTHIALTPAECAGLFENWEEGQAHLRNSTWDCLEAHTIERAVLEGSMWLPGQNTENGAKNGNGQTTIGYEANTESNYSQQKNTKTKRTVHRQYITPEGSVKLPKFKGHALYKQYPWLHQFRMLGGLPVTYLSYRFEYYDPLYNNPNDEDYGYNQDQYYIALINYGAGYGSLFVLTPNPWHSSDKTQYLINSVRECASRNIPKPNFLRNVPKAAKTMRRLGQVRALYNKVPQNVTKSILGLVGQEHIASRKTRKARKTRKHRK